MNKYESIIIVNPNVEEKQIDEIIKKINDVINSNGKVNKVENLGKKKLAYAIRNENEGIYILFEFESESRTIHELERLYRMTDEIIKFIVVHQDEE
ncbi:MAG: 30S ribosomal protein S6 [Clostridia bacterium]|nr:30S ribosomal protein S6 [Clostridia bacterium]